MPRRKPEKVEEQSAVEQETAVEVAPESEAPAEETPAVEPVADAKAEVEAEAPATDEGADPGHQEIEPAVYDFSEPTEAELEEFIKAFSTKEAFDNAMAEMPDGPIKVRYQRIAAKLVANAPAPPEPEAEVVDETFIKSGGRHLRVRGFFGTFVNCVFQEDPTKTFGVCKDVDEATYQALKTEYPGAEIEEVEEVG